MSLKRRLKKIEDSVGKKNKNCSPMMMFLFEDDDEEAILRRYREKYGEYFQPRMVIKLPETREDAVKEYKDHPFFHPDEI